MGALGLIYEQCQSGLEDSAVINRMKKLVSIIAIIGLLSGCAAQIPPEALQFNPDTLANRQLQSRKYEIKSEKELLAASNNVLQDMGFNLDESELLAHQEFIKKILKKNYWGY